VHSNEIVDLSAKNLHIAGSVQGKENEVFFFA
jgi:hypothetical protein